MVYFFSVLAIMQEELALKFFSFLNSVGWFVLVCQLVLISFLPASFLATFHWLTLPQKVLTNKHVKSATHFLKNQRVKYDSVRLHKSTESFSQKESMGMNCLKNRVKPESFGF